MSHPKNLRLSQLVIPTAAAFSVLYALVVLWYVATFPELGIRCLLPRSTDASAGVRVVRYVGANEDSLPYQLQPGDQLMAINGQPIHTFLDFLRATGRLQSMSLEPGATLAKGSDPIELAYLNVPTLVLIEGTEQRLVEVRFLRPNAENPQQQDDLTTFVSVNVPYTWDVVLTVIWFLCQSGILLIALTGYWQQPADRTTQAFCLMSIASMVAFVGGFHWWVIAANPWLDIPFIMAATLVPAATLHFFFRFPRESVFLNRMGNMGLAVLYGPMVSLGLVLSFTYWAAFALNGGPDGALALRSLTEVSRSLLLGQSQAGAAGLSWLLLYVLRILVYTTILISGLYFSGAVASIVFSRLRPQTIMERHQSTGILYATLAAGVCVGYTLYLSFFHRDAFVLGGAQLPMFFASGIFMVAYAHGMLKHRLILADEKLHRGRLYRGISIVVTASFAGLLATGMVTTWWHPLPVNSSLLLKLALFLILVMAVSFALWMRDRLQAAIDLRFFSEKYQLDHALQQLNQAAGHLTDPTAMADRTLQTCREVMDASSAMMYVREAAGSFRLIGALDAHQAATSLPAERMQLLNTPENVVLRVPAANQESMTGVQELLHRLRCEVIYVMKDDQGVAGVICLGRRASNTPYSAEDIAFLQAIGQMTILALHSSRANQNLARLTSELQVKVDHISEQQRQLELLRAGLMALEQSATSPADEDERDEGFHRLGLKGRSLAIEQVLNTARKASDSSSTVLIRGESGTGKELLARVIQANSPRSDEPFISVNCAALSPSLLESELFGHVAGAFTGAQSDKQGRFQAAHGGTLFLDEIGDIPMETQVKLLRVLQERCLEPVGSDQTIDVDVRLVAATHRNLEEMIADGSFREDLYYRLNVVSITLPPLRERRDDLIELVFSFLRNAVRKTGKPIRQVSPEALAALESHAWPGNIRELENAIERAVVLAEGDTVELTDLPEDVARQVPIVIDNATSPETLLSNLTPDESETSDVPVTRRTLDKPVDSSQERARLEEALQSAGGNKAQAARLLQMPRSTFYSKLRKLGIDGSAGNAQR